MNQSTTSGIGARLDALYEYDREPVASHKLHGIGIEAVVKDEAESARLAGFASSMLGQVEVYVHKDEAAKAAQIIEEAENKS